MGEKVSKEKNHKAEKHSKEKTSKERSQKTERTKKEKTSKGVPKRLRRLARNVPTRRRLARRSPARRRPARSEPPRSVASRRNATPKRGHPSKSALTRRSLTSSTEAHILARFGHTSTTTTGAAFCGNILSAGRAEKMSVLLRATDGVVGLKPPHSNSQEDASRCSSGMRMLAGMVMEIT